MTLRLILFALAFMLLAPARAWAAPGVTVTMISSPDLTLDSNSPCTAGPTSAYVAFRVTNTSGATTQNLRVTLGGLANGIVLGGGQAAQQFVGALAPGASRAMYWFVVYPCNFGITTTLTASATDNTAGAVTGSGTVTTYSMISAMAGGVVASAVLGPGAVVGQTITSDVAFDFGGADVGSTYNLQPVGNANFPASCFQLMRTTIVSSNVTAIAAGTENRQYFVSTTKEPGNGYRATIRYYYKYLCAGVTSQVRPYSNQLSGTQLKYSSNYETFVGPTLPGATNPFVVTKSATPDRLPGGGKATYTITVSNPSSFPAEVDSIVDLLPAGVSYDSIAPGSGITAGNSGSLPARGAVGTILFRGIPGSSYSLPAGGTLRLIYTVSVSATPGEYVNQAAAVTGTTVLGGGPASATVTVGTADLSVAKSGPATTAVSDTVRYVLTVANAGPQTAYRVTLSDTLPAGVTFVSATRAPTLVGRVLTWPAIASLANGASRVDTVVVVAPASLGTVVNVAAAASTSFDPAAANNDGSAAGARVTTTVTSSVVVTPDGLPSPRARLAGGAYGEPFTVRNASPAAGSYLLSLRTTAAGAAGTFVAVDSVTGPGITTPAAYGSVAVPLAGRSSYVYTVWYRVAAGDTAANTQFLRAQAVSDTLLRDDGFVEVRRVRPVLTLSKSVSPTGTLPSGTSLTYTLHLSNVGEFAARSVTVTDSVPQQLLLKVGSVSQTLPSGMSATVTYLDGSGAVVTPGAAGCAAVAGFDSCVRRIIWTLSGDLPAGASLSDGQFAFVARIK